MARNRSGGKVGEHLGDEANAIGAIELDRESLYADHKKRMIGDDLDDFGHTFIVRADGATLGTLRGNLSREGPLGIRDTPP